MTIQLTHTCMIIFRGMAKNTKPDFWRAPPQEKNGAGI